MLAEEVGEHARLLLLLAALCGGEDDAIKLIAAGPKGARFGRGAKNPFKLPCLAVVGGLRGAAANAAAEVVFSLECTGELDRKARRASKIGGEDGGGVTISEEGPDGEEHDSSIEYEDELEGACC